MAPRLSTNQPFVPLLRNDLARHWVNHFRPELKCLEVRSALLPAAAMRRPRSSDRGPSRGRKSRWISDSSWKTNDTNRWLTLFLLTIEVRSAMLVALHHEQLRAHTVALTQSCRSYDFLLDAFVITSMNFSYRILDPLLTHNTATDGLNQTPSMPRHHDNAPTLLWTSLKLVQPHRTRPQIYPYESSYVVHTICYELV